ncbi:LysR family transcriptional regulator [Aliigemmobacter aestuarii]|uniref:LysR family transcriptional regulator n=1 Tax=Aliigemmobacter aestuarii TaxID=1445661 RepID=A0A4S3ML98_9RHOB|nr:LysR substrate-binding domain-containing protein [Gemmobacter aestuarii]THD82350.1 LysR family transcriptional regulator [Gemmobacter aestuarii]
METLRSLLPSINSLVVFEAAGRLSSFTAAAREMGMTQAAVSYAIRSLEDHLGSPLFLREHRRVRLTEAGERFHADVSIGLSHIQRSAQNLRAVATGSHVTLSCSTAFAAFWMVPRMARFRADLPRVDLRIQTADRNLDLVGEGIPLGIRGGDPGDWPQYQSEPLAPEEIFPVCGAGYLAGRDRPEVAADLLAHQLIHLEEPFRSAATWKDWFASVGIEGKRVPRGLSINDYVLVVQSVIEGQGVALGWRHLVEGLVAKGVLVRLTDHMLTTGKGFHVVWPRDAALSRAAQDVRDWLLDQRPGTSGTP